MLHATNSKMVKKVAIIGAGISGLSLGWSLKKKYGENIQLSILEKSNRTGGWIETIDRDGFLFELGPRGCRPTGAGKNTLKLVEELGLEHEVITNHPNAKSRYLYFNQTLNQIPTNLKLLFQSPFLLFSFSTTYPVPILLILLKIWTN